MLFFFKNNNLDNLVQQLSRQSTPCRDKGLYLLIVAYVNISLFIFYPLSDQGDSYLTYVRTICFAVRFGLYVLISALPQTICFAVRRSCRNRTTPLSLLIKNSIHFYTLEFFSFVCQNTICVWIIEISLNFHIYWSKIHQYTHT